MWMWLSRLLASRSSPLEPDLHGSSTHRHRISVDHDSTELEQLVRTRDATGDAAPPRKIRRAIGYDQVNEGSSNQPSAESWQQLIEAQSKMEDSFPRFGPYYVPEHAFISDSKDKCLEHVLENTPSTGSFEAKESYLGVINRRFSEQATGAYEDNIECSPSEFREMMLKDGCFFLHLAFLILGKREKLKYPDNNLIFGIKQDEEDIQRWIKSMFFPGNQIPLIVLKKLMAQSFFIEVTKGFCDPPPTSSWYKRILYELLIAPSSAQQGEAQPCDLLHGLHDMVVGPGHQMKKSGIKEVDLEANTIVERIIGTSPYSIETHKRIFPSAEELAKSGVRIKKLSNGGVRGISFNTHYLWTPSLYLPILPIDHDVEMIFRYLRSYEDSQQFENNLGGEVNSYLLLMSNLIRTSNDVRLLRKKGIIQVAHDFDYEDELPEMLTRVSIGKITLTYEFRILKRRISEYSGAAWTRFRGILNLVVLVAVLTLIQTVFVLLAYFYPLEQDTNSPKPAPSTC